MLVLLILSVLVHSCKERTQAHNKKIKIVLRSCVFASLKLASFDLYLSAFLSVDGKKVPFSKAND